MSRETNRYTTMKDGAVSKIQSLLFNDAFRSVCGHQRMRSLHQLMDLIHCETISHLSEWKRPGMAASFSRFQRRFDYRDSWSTRQLTHSILSNVLVTRRRVYCRPSFLYLSPNKRCRPPIVQSADKAIDIFIFDWSLESRHHLNSLSETRQR